MDAKRFQEEQLLDLEEDENNNECNADDIELDGIEVSKWDNRNGLWLVPEDQRLELRRQHHDSLVAGHCGRPRAQELVSRNFTWHRWLEDVENYVAGCIECQISKADRHSRQTKLVPMPPGERPWEEIPMDFVVELPESEGFNAILVITVRLTKVQYYLPAKTTCTAADVVNAYIDEIWRLHGLPRHMSSVRGPPFAYKFSKELNRKLNINLRLSTTYHPQTDGLSERAVQALKQYLRIYCLDRQIRWRAWLPLAEFAYNTISTTTHGYSPYRSLYGFDPRTIHLDNNYELSSAVAEEWLN